MTGTTYALIAAWCAAVAGAPDSRVAVLMRDEELASSGNPPVEHAVAHPFLPHRQALPVFRRPTREHTASAGIFLRR